MAANKESTHICMIDTAPNTDPVHAAGGCYCRECKRRNSDGWCTFYGIPDQGGKIYCHQPKDDDFCSYGERKGD